MLQLQASKRFHSENISMASKTPYVVWPEKINDVKVDHHNLLGNLVLYHGTEGLSQRISHVHLRPLWDRQDCSWEYNA